jgi:hypothetical protein
MAVINSKWPKNIPNVSIPMPSKIYPNWDFWFENYTIWQPWFWPRSEQTNFFIELNALPSCPYKSGVNANRGFASPCMRTARGQCYGHYFRRFSPTFGRKNWRFFLKTNVSIQFLSKLAVFGVRKRHFFENVLKIITLTPADTFRNRYPPILTHCSYILRRQLQKELRGASL